MTLGLALAIGRSLSDPAKRAADLASFNPEGVNMGNDERSGSGSRINWPARLSGGVGAVAGFLLSLQAISLASLDGF